MAGVEIRGVPRSRAVRMVAWLAAAASLLALPAAQAAEAAPVKRALALAQVAADTDDEGLARVIVKYRSGSTLAVDGAGTPRHARRLGRQLGLDMEDRHVLGARTQSLRARGIGSAALAAKLAARADVEWAVPVRRKHINAALPNDPYFSAGQTTITPAVGQWYLRAPDSTAVAATNALGAWAITEGSASIVVAVVDTGVRLDHPDLAGKLLPGYDFVSRTSISADGGGADNDPSDPGDWSASSDSCGASNSSWHGTQVAGLVGAATDNGIGIAGTGRSTMVLPVRVLGKCGGFDDDIQAGMRWAGGLSNAGSCTSTSAVSATCNPNPAKVINLSLGSSGSCSAAYRTLISDLNTAGVSVVVASGNDNGLAVNEPANCAGAIAVAGIRHAGTKVGYSNLGPEISLAAPAGNCVNEPPAPCLYPLLTTDNSGTSTPGTNSYSSSGSPSLGTSFASPIVAGTAALMLAANSALTPAQVKSMLKSGARAFPTTGAQEPGTVACRAPSAIEQIECYCTTSTCGAGMLDAQAAVSAAAAAIAAPTAALGASASTVLVGAQLTLSGTGSVAHGGRSIAGYAWVVTSGSSVVNLSSGSGSSVVVTALAAGTATVQLTVTDSAGATGTAGTTITVNAVSPPTASFSASPASPTAGSTATLDAAGSSAFGGRGIAGYQWLVTDGGGIASLAGSTGSTATLNTSAAGTVTVQLTVTDSAGASGSVSQTITVAAAPVVVTPPSTSSGGGGAMGAGWVLGLVAASLALWRSRPGRR